MTDNLLIAFILLSTLSLSRSILTGPLSPGSFRVNIPSGPFEIGVSRPVSIEFMTSDWTVDTSNNNYQTTFVGVQGSPNILYAQHFENANLDFTYITTGSNQTTNLTIDQSQTAKGTNSSAKLVGGYQTDFTGLDFGQNATPVRLSAYMRASSAGIGGASMSLSMYNATGFFPLVQVLFDSDNNIKLKRLSSPGNVTFSNPTPFSPNKWYKIDLLISWSNSTISFWVDGLLVTQGFPFYFNPASTVPYVNGINFWNNNATTTWIDQIEVVNSEVNLADITISFSPGGTTPNVNKGVWNGSVTINTLQPSMQLRAYRTTGGLNYDGFSSEFSVVVPSPSPSRTPSPSITPSSSPTPSVTTTPSQKKKDNTNTIALAAGVGAGAFCLTGVVLVALVTKRFKSKDSRRLKKSPTGIDLPMKPIYVASTMTESEFRMAIRYQDLLIGREIGRGAFGSVFTASWRNSDCVVKQLNIDNTDTQAVNDFLKEATLVLRLRPHRNVCQIFGVCNNPEYPICIVMEYVTGGSLKELVYEPLKTPLNFPMVLGFAKDIASGMIHIHAENLLHCDLACRNLLSSAQGENSWTIKVSDFGLARTSESGIYNATQEAKFPIRWSAPEVLTDRKVSRASDVWSFGVVLWEILEGKMPFYELMNNNDVIFAVCTKKEHLPVPTKRVDYPDKLYELMLTCWSYNPADRPTFDEIYSKLIGMEPQKKFVEQTQDNFALSSGAHEYNEFTSTSEFDLPPIDNNSTNYSQELQRSDSKERQYSSLYGNREFEM